MVKTEQLQVQTRGNNHVVDITEPVAAVVAGCGIRAGVATLFTVGSTAGLTTTEYEPGLANHDLKAAFERIAPEDGFYEHENTWHDDNGHSHVRASLLGPSLVRAVCRRPADPGHLAADHSGRFRHAGPYPDGDLPDSWGLRKNDERWMICLPARDSTRTASRQSSIILHPSSIGKGVLDESPIRAYDYGSVSDPNPVFMAVSANEKSWLEDPVSGQAWPWYWRLQAAAKRKRPRRPTSSL